MVHFGPGCANIQTEMSPTSPRPSIRSGPASKPSVAEGKSESLAIVPPGTKIARAKTVEEAVRTLEACPSEGVVVLDAKVLAEATKAFLRRNRIEDRGGSEEVVPVFTPKHLNILFGDLTYAQQTFLLCLLRDPGAFVSREELFRAIRGGTGQDKKDHRSHALNQIACDLRKILGPRGAGQCIETIHGTGFRWNRQKEPESLSFDFLKVAGLAMLSVFAVVAGVHRFAHEGHDEPGVAGPFSTTDGNALVSDGARFGSSASDDPVASAPYQAMRTLDKSGALGEPTASVAFAKGHSPWRSVDGLKNTWFESDGPARAGDWLAFRILDSSDGSAESDCARRIEIRFGRPDAAVSPFAPPCRVEWSSDPSAGASSAWQPLGDVAPATELFVADLPAAPVAAIRVIVTADSSTSLSVREAGVSGPEAE